jgi:hypothetical protein
MLSSRERLPYILPPTNVYYKNLTNTSQGYGTNPRPQKDPRKMNQFHEGGRNREGNSKGREGYIVGQYYQVVSKILSGCTVYTIG